MEQPDRPANGAAENGGERDTRAIQAAVAAALARRRIPRATYRLQLNGDFTFRDAAAQMAYLQDLGISDVYASPILRARSGSTHGYDVCDPGQLNPNLGTDADFAALSAELQARDMGLLLDTVPNHMGVNEACNTWWMDVLENGPSSPYAHYFDIDWHPIKPELENKVLLPVLGDQYGDALESGQIQLHYEGGAFFLTYYESRLPLAPRTYATVLERCLAELQGRRPPAPPEEATAAPAPAAAPAGSAALAADPAAQELQSILTAVRYLPPRTETDPERLAERHREKEIIKRRLAALSNAEPRVADALATTLKLFNGAAGDSHSFDLLDQLIEAQPYRLAFWRVAGEEINYRRFFDVNDLAAIRVEAPDVFDATHALILRLLRQGQVTGLRIDHPDGLWDPASYFRRLQEANVALYLPEPPAAAEALPAAAPGDATLSRDIGDWLAGESERQGYGACTWPLYIVAEKILSEAEPLPRDWAVCGTTGYDFMAAVNNLFVRSSNAAAFDRIYERFIGHTVRLSDLTITTKMTIMRESLASEINSLSHQVERIAERNRHYRDFTLNGLTAALRELIACLSIYRTYVNATTGAVSPRDRKYVESAIAHAKRRRPGIATAVFDFLRDTLLLRNIDHFRPEDQAELASFIMKFQQISSPVMAKGVEDTAFYIYNRLVSLNEVGSSPDQFGASVAEFHRHTAARAAQWPNSLLATSTHDNKRSEDVRARINVLSEVPEAWRVALNRWSRLNSSRRQLIEGRPAPDRNDEYLFYQTLLGSWPFAAPDVLEEVAPEEPAPAGMTGSPSVAIAALALAKSAAAPGSVRVAPAILLSPTAPEFADYRARIQAYMLKAVKEAKVHTSWINPDKEYDQAIGSFVERVLTPSSTNRFLAEFMPLAQRVAFYGRFNSLSQLLLKLTAPGVPDIYQGNELWDFSLVDPDNRRPVDYELRRRHLADVAPRLADSDPERRVALAHELLATCPDGRIKLFITMAALDYRRRQPDLFRHGEYLPLQATGAKADYAVAFARRREQQQAVTVVPRLVVGLTNDIERGPLGADVWDDTWLPMPDLLPGHAWRNIYTGETLAPDERDGRPGLRLADVLANFPVALLIAART